MTFSNSRDTAPISQTSVILLEEFRELDAQAEKMGATKIRRTIASAIEDLPEPEGKKNARMAILEVREALRGFRRGASASRPSSIPPLDSFGEATT
ncbi:hypothetical protein KJ657_01400 [Patescibacteria group bacterium]|nr:hypothetical protein [Patescibacteria group bacterium]MBU1015724.1 hypothetical protein [Patescibacteria group bacterium]MBU1684896.1 hypothetical protein [Patescibacteria group bacterium]MBU1938646.1 hypothetical protein [Patescibacteria group bacterium]